LAAELPDQAVSREMQCGRRTLGGLVLANAWILGGIVLTSLLLGLASYPWPGGLRLTGHVVARTVALQLGSDADLDVGIAIDGGKVALAQIQWIELPSEFSNVGRLETNAAQVTARRLVLRTVHLTQGLAFTLRREDEGQLIVHAGSGGATFEFEATGSVVVTTDSTKLVAAERAEEPFTIVVGIDGQRAPPMVMRGQETGALVLGPLTTSLLRFGDLGSVTGLGTEFISTIQSGSIRLLDVDVNKTLDPGAALAIGAFHGSVFRLKGSRDGFEIWFTGRADTVDLGPPGFSESLTPSVLIFLVHQESLKLLWAGAGLCIAGLLQVRKWHGDSRSN
jgi:hypothetical protein